MMKLPLAWLMDYLPESVRGLGFKTTLDAACKRWALEPASEPAQTLGRLMTFAGFGCDAVQGAGMDAVLELDVLSNRPDAQCVVGLAREIAAIFQVDFCSPSFDLSGIESGEPATTLAKVTVEESELCPRYTARIIRGVKVGPSPKWLKDRLESMGLQSRNNIVDVTNFICFELNQPLHAFDLNTLEGRQILVRRAKDKESFTPLYGEIPVLTHETLVIADGKHARAIAGVLGGKGSEITSETVDLLLESAYFNPANTRRTVRRLKVMDGRGTDSSYRFERGIDLESVERASARAARLIVEVAGGSVAPGVIDVWPRRREVLQLELRNAELKRVFGVAVPPEIVRQVLTSIGCRIVSHETERVIVQVPSWRRGDLEREIDLIEEVARLYGFNHVPDTTAMSARVPARSATCVAEEKLRTLLTSHGYFEAITDSLIDPRWPLTQVWTDAKAIVLDRSSILREDHSVLRNSLLSSLLAVRRHNQDQRTGEARLFEIGKVFLPTEKEIASALPIRPCEKKVLGILDDRGFFSLRDTLGRLVDSLEIESAHLKFVPCTDTPAFMATGQACQILRVRELAQNDRVEDMIGWIGTISPALQKAFDLRKSLAMCELDLNAIASLPSAPRRYQSLPEFPEIIRDIALVVPENVAWGDVDSFARSHAKHDVLRDAKENPQFLSVFRGKQVGEGKKSVAFSIVYRAKDRTLTDEEVHAAHSKFKQALVEKFKATLRE